MNWIYISTALSDGAGSCIGGVGINLIISDVTSYHSGWMCKHRHLKMNTVHTMEHFNYHRH